MADVQQKDTLINNGFEVAPAPIMERLTSLIKAKVPIIWVITHEESRFISEFKLHVADKTKRDLWTWSTYRGLTKYLNSSSTDQIEKANGDMAQTPNISQALEAIINQPIPKDKNGIVYLMKDFHTVNRQPVPRQLRDMYDFLYSTKKTILIVSSALNYGPGGSGLEPTLDKQVVVLDYGLPTKPLIKSRLQKTIDSMLAGSQADKLDPECHEYEEHDYETFATALQGLTDVEVSNAILTCLVEKHRLDEKWLLTEKKQVIKKSDILEYIEQSPSFSDVGGCDEVKKYFEMYQDQFSEDAKNFGVDPLRGVLMVGVPGCGKSLLAKAVAAKWNLPLLRLDVGKVMTGLVGGSEQKMREVIDQAEAMAPAILWIDEIEKSLSGTGSSNFSDGGTLSRVFGTLLTAMEERMHGIVTIATANDIAALPPELIRRFNEVFFVDLPTEEEREEIFTIHFGKKNRKLETLKLNMPELLNASDKYTGSEIEKAVKESVARAYQDGKREVRHEDVLGALQDTKAISKVMGEKIQAIRDWAKGKARYASSLAATANSPGAQKVKTKSGKKLDLSENFAEMDEIKLTKKPKPNLDNVEDRTSGILDE